MKVIKVYPRNFGSNCYIVTADNKTAAVIDPAEPDICERLDAEGLQCKHVLLTHGHFDHVGGCGALYLRGAQICCGVKEKELIFSKEFLGIFGGVFVPHFEVSKTFSDGEEIELCGIKFKVIATPGHTLGSVCYLAGDCIFSGDTLFAGSVGRWDLPTGDFASLKESVKKLGALKGDYKIYCGHEGETTLENERRYNEYLRN